MPKRIFSFRGQAFTDPPVARALFDQTEWAWLWLIARVWLGYQWLVAAAHKLDDPRWMTTGEAMRSFWERAVKVPAAPAKPVIAYDWYRDFIEVLLNGGHYEWFAKLITITELAVGVALVLGAFVGIAAFAGAFMNWHFMMAGTASINPLMIVVGFLLVLAWKTAGWWGVDRWVLPAVGTPWQPGGLPQFLTDLWHRSKSGPLPSSGGGATGAG